MSIALNVPKQNSNSGKRARTTKRRLLMAMSETEADLFGLRDLSSRLPGLDYDWYRTNSGGAEVWWEVYNKFEPDILLSSWSTPNLDAVLPQTDNGALRYVCQVTGSVRHVVPRRFLLNGGLVSNWGGAVAPQVAEHALLLALSILRRSPEWRMHLQHGKEVGPKRWLKTETLFGRRVGVHGFGNVARALIALLQPFGVSLQVYSYGVSSEWIEQSGSTPSSSLRELFKRSDVLFECEALNSTTKGSVSAEVLAALPDGAVFINVGRGLVVDEAALLSELKSGRIFGAMDVLHSEPISPDTPFLDLPNALISPHIAGPTFDQYQPCGDLACRNIDRFIRGDLPEAALTLEAYDRST